MAGMTLLDAAVLDTIWKFPVPSEDDFTLEMPAGSVPLSVGVQNGEIVLWAAVNSASEAMERHRFFLRGTGHPLRGAFFHRFVGTVQLERLGLVFHLFDGGQEESNTIFPEVE
jgi:hypothetical protein